MQAEGHVEGHREAEQDDEEDGAEEEQVDAGDGERRGEQVHLRHERDVLEDPEEEEEAADGAEVLHLLQLPHERL